MQSSFFSRTLQTTGQPVALVSGAPSWRRVLIGGNFGAPAGVIIATIDGAADTFQVGFNQYAALILGPEQTLSVEVVAGSPPVPMSVHVSAMVDEAC